MSLVPTGVSAITIVGILLWLALVFQALMGMRIIKLKGPLHWRVHRILAFTIIGVGVMHGAAAIAGFVFQIWL